MSNLDKVTISKDGKSIAFVQSEQIPASPKKFRQSPEIEGFYRFVYENDIRKEALDVIEKLLGTRKAIKAAEKMALRKKS
jgi:hypothetical protein